jgi:hypothetical protein
MAAYKRKDVPWRLIEGKALVVNPETSLIYPLNTVGSRIWELLDGTRSFSELTAILVQEFDTDEETALADLADFVHDLEKAGLVQAS